MEKFTEIKDLVKSSQPSAPVDVKPLAIPNPHSNGTDSASPASHRMQDVPVKAEVETATFSSLFFIVCAYVTYT